MNTTKRLLYVCGQIGIMGMTRYLFGWIIKFAATESPRGTALFSATVVGGVFFAFRIFDGVTDPFAGFVSDRQVSEGHERRRLLWFAFALPPVGLTLCFLPNHTMPPELRWLLLLSGLFIFFVGYTFYAVPYWSLIDDYSKGDHHERRLLSTLLGAGLLGATAIGFIAGPLLVDHLGYATGALAFAIPGSVLMVLPYFASPANVLVSQHTKTERIPFGKSLKISLSHRRFLAFLILFSGSQMSFTIMTAAAPFIAIDLLGGNMSDVALLLGPLLLCAILSFPFVPRISRRIGWERGVLFASLALAAVYGLSALLGRGFIGSPLSTAMVIFACGGPMSAIVLGLEGEAITACARERDGDLVSTYFGVFNLIVKTLNGVALLIAGFLADLSRGELGPLAVRLMAVTAGAFLITCSLVSLSLRQRKSGAHSVAS